MKRVIVFVLTASLLLGGCGSMFDGNYVSMEQHREQNTGGQSGVVSASNYTQLRDALVQMADSGSESSVINVAEYDQELLENAIEIAADYVKKTHPIGAYAVENISYEIGTGGGKPAVSVSISYIHGRSEIRKIKTVRDMTVAQDKCAEALEKCESGLVVLVKNYSSWDVTQFVEDYAALHPDLVMEIPTVAVGVYPDTGMERVVELKFTYQTSRESLRQMQTQVEPIFSAASLYVVGNGTEAQKYTQLYAFLMERFDYQIQTSLTPAYSLLCHGVGDCEAFATVYAAMCRQSDLACQVITGSKNGEPWFWNLICEEGTYYHVDLMECNSLGQFKKMTRADMAGYVWDYSAYEAEDSADRVE